MSGAGTGGDATTTLVQWVREELRIDDDATVTVGELASTKPGCPPLETVISVVEAGEEPFVLKIHKPIAEVDRMDVVTALAFGDDHG
ncbi:hypothetical protein BH18ACT4_BH18ACT4_03750 [soil metagenome]